MSNSDVLCVLADLCRHSGHQAVVFGARDIADGDMSGRLLPEGIHLCNVDSAAILQNRLCRHDMSNSDVLCVLADLCRHSGHQAVVFGARDIADGDMSGRLFLRESISATSIARQSSKPLRHDMPIAMFCAFWPTCAGIQDTRPSSSEHATLPTEICRVVCS